MADWDKMALMNVLIGFEAEILGVITYSVTPNWFRSHAVQGLLIVAFVLYAIGAALMAASKINGGFVNIAVSIIVMICMLITGVFLVVGVGIYDYNNVYIPYSVTLMMSAAFLAFLTLIFLIVHLCTGGSRNITTTTTTTTTHAHVTTHEHVTA
jgi:cytochrome b subunit of formate dehydrogenase